MNWHVVQDPRDPNAWDVYDGPSKFAHLTWCKKSEADLIAAAPEMLEALRALSEFRAYSTIPAVDYDRVRSIAAAAIRKAEGR